MSEAVGFNPIDRADHVVLVVDDDPVSRYTTIRWLQHAGFQTREAASGARGMELADASVSAMVLDVYLPDINGFDLCRQIRSRDGPDYLPVLHLSAAYVTDEDKVRGLDSGADAYLTHPVDPAVLVATVQALVRTRVAEGALRRSEQHFRTMYERAPIGMCLLDLAGRVIEANPCMLSILGRAAGDVVGRPLSEWVPGESREAAQAFLAIEVPTGEDVQFPLVRGDGFTLRVSWSMLPLLQHGVHMMLATDVTAPVLLEEQRQLALQRERTARADAERLGRIKDEFVAVLSHELRTPLTTMIGWMQIFRRGPLDEARQQKGLEVIERNLALQARLVSDLLDMSSINLGKMRLSLSPVSVPELVQSVVEAAEASITDRGVSVDLHVDANCPVIRADPARLQQIASNLLGNAIKFSPPGGVIAIVLKPEGAGLSLSLSDHGVGIAKEFLPNLFDRFSQADAGSNRRHGGLGLGLSIVRHLAESHDGRVAVRSDGLGHGATFDVWLPTAGPGGDETSVDHADPDVGDADATLAGASLLVVEDDPDIGATLSLILRDRGARVRVATNYEEALSAMRTDLPDVLLSDIGMPGKDGYALIKEIRSDSTLRHVPAVAITSYAREQDRVFALTSGFDAHCPKPVRAIELVHVVQRLMAGKEDERANSLH
jgi:PAS domain S-box-containing protein